MTLQENVERLFCKNFKRNKLFSFPFRYAFSIIGIQHTLKEISTAINSMHSFHIDRQKM